MTPNEIGWARTVEKPIYLREDLHQMAKKKQFVTAAAAFAVAASAVAPAITADAASTTVRLSSDYVRVGDLDATLDKEYNGSEIYWYKSSVDMNKLGVFQTAKGFVKGQGIRVEKRVRVLNYAQEIKPESEFVFEQGVPVSGIRVQPVLFADGNEYAKPLSVAGFNTDKVGEFEGTLTYANRAYGVVTKTVKYKVVASKVAFSEVKHEVEGDMLSVSADVKNLKDGEKVELVIFPGKDESAALPAIEAEIKDGKVMASAKDIPAGTHSFILRSGDVKTAAMEFMVEAPMVKEVKAINGTQVTVEFNREITEINPANLEVTRKDDNSRAYVSQVTVDANNKKMATVTFTSKLADDKSYTLVADGVKTIKGEVKDSKSEFTYAKSVVTKVELSSTDLAASGNIKDSIKVTDQLGRDITKEVALEIQSSNTSIIDATGAAKGTGAVIINVKVAGTTVQTGNVVVTVNAAKQSSLVGFHLADKSNAPSTTEAFTKVKPEDVVTTLEKGMSTDLNLYYKDQFGKSMAVVNGSQAVYTSLNPAVVAVNADGKITAVSTGVGAVKVKVGDFETTINVTVKAAATIDEMILDKTVVNAAIGAIAPTFKVSFEDQYNEEINFTEGFLTVVSADKTIADVEKVDKGVVTIKAVKEGTTNFTVKYDNGSVKLEKVVSVTVTKAGTINTYALASNFTKLDTYADDTDTKEDSTVAKITVSEKDAAGNVLNNVDASSTKLEFSSSTPASVKALLTINDDADTVTLTTAPEGTFTATVDVKVGSLVVGSITYTISDSTLKATKASFTKTAFDGLTSGQDVISEFINNIKFVDQNNADITVAANDVKVEYVLSNQVNGFEIDNEGKLSELVDQTKVASADVVITAVKVDGGSNLLAGPVVIKAETDQSVALTNAKAEAKTKIEAAETSVNVSLATAQTAVDDAKEEKATLLADDPNADTEAVDQKISDAEDNKIAVEAKLTIVTNAKSDYVSKTSVTAVNAEVEKAETAATEADDLVK